MERISALKETAVSNNGSADNKTASTHGILRQVLAKLRSERISQIKE